MTTAVSEVANVIVADEAPELHLIAHSREQMAAAQTKLVAWAQRKIDEQKEIADEASQAKTVALAGNFNTAPFHRQLTRANKMVEFYTKIKAALEAGYVIIPDFPVDVFAIRTNRLRPVPKESKWHNETRNQSSESPPIGQGTYVDSDPLIQHTRTEYPQDPKTKEVNPVCIYGATDFQDTIDFPLSIARAEIMDDVSCAMQHKIFDEIGVLPDRRKIKKDPIVTGIIRDPRSTTYDRRRVMFLLAWYLDTRTL